MEKPETIQDHQKLLDAGFEWLGEERNWTPTKHDFDSIAEAHGMPVTELHCYRVASSIWGVYRVPEDQRAKPGEPVKLGASFETVMEAVYQERQYQEAQKARADSHVAPMQNLAGYILAMEYQLEQARTLWYHDHVDRHRPAMEHIRKLVALGVAAGEQFGMPERQQ